LPFEAGKRSANLLLSYMWKAKEKKNEIKLSFKYRIYPTREAEERILKVMQVEAEAQYPSGCNK
jgi:hypothetical protein